jgi:hypothetical protein
MKIPFVINNLDHRLADTLNELLGRCIGKPLDISTAYYFTISGDRLVKDGLHHLGVFRLLIGHDPQTGSDVGLKVDQKALKARLNCFEYASG